MLELIADPILEVIELRRKASRTKLCRSIFSDAGEPIIVCKFPPITVGTDIEYHKYMKNEISIALFACIEIPRRND